MKAKNHPGGAIRRARRAVEMTQLQLALAVNRSPSFITNFEACHPRLGQATRAEVAAMRRAIQAFRRDKGQS